MFRLFRIWWHKREARFWHYRILELLEIYDCGDDLIDMLTGGQLTRYRGRKQHHVEMLQQLDPNFPGAKK